MKHVTKFLSLVTILGATSYASNVWLIDTNGQLYGGFAGSSTFTTIGTAEAAGTRVSTLAAYSGTLYGVNNGGNDTVYSINETTGVETSVFNLGNLGAIAALTADAQGNLWAASGSKVYEYSLGGTQLAAYTLTNTIVDLEFVGTTLYAVQSSGLYTITGTGTTGTATPVGGTTGIQATTTGLAYSNSVVNTGGTVYGYTSGNTLYSVNPGGAASGASALIGIVGTGTIVDAASDAIPEPASMGLIGLGLVTLGGFAHRRRKA